MSKTGKNYKSRDNKVTPPPPQAGKYQTGTSKSHDRAKGKKSK